MSHLSVGDVGGDGLLSVADFAVHAEGDETYTDVDALDGAFDDGLVFTLAASSNGEIF